MQKHIQNVGHHTSKVSHQLFAAANPLPTADSIIQGGGGGGGGTIGVTRSSILS